MSDEAAGNDIRAEAERHIADHSVGEAARIGRLSRIREFVLGAQDGLLVPLEYTYRKQLLQDEIARLEPAPR